MDKYLDVPKLLVEKWDEIVALAAEKIAPFECCDYADISIGCIDPLGAITIRSATLVANGVTSPFRSVQNLLELLAPVNTNTNIVGVIARWEACRTTVAVGLISTCSYEVNQRISAELLSFLTPE